MTPKAYSMFEAFLTVCFPLVSPGIVILTEDRMVNQLFTSSGAETVERSIKSRKRDKHPLFIRAPLGSVLAQFVPLKV